MAHIVKRGAALVDLTEDWAAHSLRSGFMADAGRQGVPLGEVVAMTEHRSVGTVMGNFEPGSLLYSRVALGLTRLGSWRADAGCRRRLPALTSALDHLGVQPRYV